jgi:hypothetical protein
MKSPYVTDAQAQMNAVDSAGAASIIIEAVNCIGK